MKICTIPTILTLTRLIISPLILPFLFVYLLPFNILWINGILAGIFGVISLTDFFDGYFARKLHQETVTGKILDPLADKFLINSTLVALLAAGKIYFYWVVLLIGRELFVTGLRCIALEHHISLSVSWWGKLKTAVQMLMLTVMIVNPYQTGGMKACNWNGIEFLLLMLTLILSLYSAWRYYTLFMNTVITHDIHKKE